LKRENPDFKIVCEDESTFLYDSVSRKVWVQKCVKPRRYVTGLHKKIHIFGFLSEDKKKLFISNKKMNAKSFLKSLYQIGKRFGKVILILDRAPWHRAKRVQSYLEKHRREIKIVWFPRGCPEMNPVEECWRQAKREVNGGKVHESFEMMKKELRYFLKYQEFKQDMRKYLRP
jgi:putative transposase